MGFVPNYIIAAVRSTSNPTVNDDVNDGHYFGSRWHNTSTGKVFECTDPSAGAAVWESSSNYLFSPSQYRDINVSGFVLSGPAATLPSEVEFKDSTGTDTGITTRGFDVGEGVDGSFELQHDYEEGTDITFHIHWQGLLAPAGGTDNVKWQLEYTIGKTGVALAAPTTITTETAYTTQYAFVVSSFSAISGTGLTIGNQFLFRLSRVAASADEYAGLALIATAGIHYLVNSAGSASASSK